MAFSQCVRVALSFSRSSTTVLANSRSFVSLTRRNCGVHTTRIRTESSLATARTPIPEPQETTEPSTPDPLSFSSLKGIIHRRSLKAITYKPFQYEQMSPVQAQVLPLLPDLALPYDPNTVSTGPPRDLLVKAKTGTGKTLAFLVPAIEARLKAIDAHTQKSMTDSGLESNQELEERTRRAFARDNVGTLIISPTRELATQIATEAQKLTSHHERFDVQLFVGGESKNVQMRHWIKGNKDIVVATPGRLRDFLMNEPDVSRCIAKTHMLILDEADTLLDMGFRDDIDAITSELPPSPQRQTFLFSATVSPAIQQIARSTLARNHKFINCVSEDSSPVHAHIPQYHTILPSAEHQIPHLLRLIAHDQLSNPGASKVIVFLPTTKMTQLFSSVLREAARTLLPAGRNTTVYEIHSKRTMDQRTRVSGSFRRDQSGASVLVTSDVSARGVDYPNVSRVIQIGVPTSAEQYVHRVGRTGRAASTGGRGDLVLLPWEMKFVTHTLTEVPLKPLTVAELASQSKALAQKFDEDPLQFFANAPKHAPERVRDSRRPIRMPVTGHKMFSNPVAAVVEEIDRETPNIIAKLDETSVEETFMSLLGYYVSRTQDLRVDKTEVLDGCKVWAMEAGGLQSAPYVSMMFLNKLGFGGAGRDARRSGGRPRPSSSGPTKFGEWTGGRSSGSRGRAEGSKFGQSRSYESREDGGFDRGRSGGERGGYGRRSDGYGRDNTFKPRNDRSDRSGSGFSERRGGGGFGDRNTFRERKSSRAGGDW